LTTAIINAVAARQTGVAAGINNAVASLANLLAVAIIGAVALAAYNRALDHRLSDGALPSEVTRAITEARGNFAADVRAQGEIGGWPKPSCEICSPTAFVWSCCWQQAWRWREPCARQ
jgi:hypothetical protein